MWPGVGVRDVTGTWTNISRWIYISISLTTICSDIVNFNCLLLAGKSSSCWNECQRPGIQVHESVSSSSSLSLTVYPPFPHFLYLLCLSSPPLPPALSYKSPPAPFLYPSVSPLRLSLSPSIHFSLFPSFLQNWRMSAPDLKPYYLFQTWLPRSFVTCSSLCISLIWILNSQSTWHCSKYHLQPERELLCNLSTKNQFPQGLTLTLISQWTGVPPCT